MKKIAIILATLLVMSCSILDEVPMSRVQNILEDFCLRSYSSCFSNRSYVPNTLKISKLETVKGLPNTIRVEGIHVYKGMLGTTYPNAPFKAEISFKTINGERIIDLIKFYKRSKSDLFHSEDYWETGIVPYSTPIK